MEPTDYNATLLSNGIITLYGEIDSTLAGEVINKIKYLELVGFKGTATLLINSPGGEVHAGFAIYDAMRLSPVEISTVAIGEADSIAAVILSGGARNMRFATENAKILIHQPMGGANGQATDILISARNISEIRHRINAMLAKNTGTPLKKVERDTERDNIFTPQKALDYGLIDKILKCND